MSVHSPQGAPPPPPPGPPTAKKGLSPLAWVGIGCGALLVLGLIAMVAGGIFVKNKVQEVTEKYGDNPEMAVVEALVAANPDFEKVSSDADAKTITVRNKKTGEEITLDMADIKEGRWEVTTKEGKTTVGAEGVTVTDAEGKVSTYGAATGALPAWLPKYPNTTGEPAGAFESTSPEGKTATFTITTADPVDQVLTFYETELKGAGFKATKNTYATDGATGGGTVSGTSADEKRTFNVLATADNGQTQAVVSYTEKP
ncbi:MAG TPA: hypothetical protein VEG34_18895 [Thermoanaerobaculia bacterium]|nr:hypothetical protein [Thermoanaerobaculia bacterium]